MSRDGVDSWLGMAVQPRGRLGCKLRRAFGSFETCIVDIFRSNVPMVMAFLVGVSWGGGRLCLQRWVAPEPYGMYPLLLAPSPSPHALTTSARAFKPCPTKRSALFCLPPALGPAFWLWLTFGRPLRRRLLRWRRHCRRLRRFVQNSPGGGGSLQPAGFGWCRGGG